MIMKNETECYKIFQKGAVQKVHLVVCVCVSTVVTSETEMLHKSSAQTNSKEIQVDEENDECK